MGIWAGIKYALNSTLGTSEFMSLDRLINSKIKRYTTGTAVLETKTYTGSTFQLSAPNIKNVLIASFYLPYDGEVYVDASLTNETGIANGKRYGFYTLYIGDMNNPLYVSTLKNGNISKSNIKIPVKAYELINVWSSVSVYKDNATTSTSSEVVGTTAATINIKGTLVMG